MHHRGTLNRLLVFLCFAASISDPLFALAQSRFEQFESIERGLSETCQAILATHQIRQTCSSSDSCQIASTLPSSSNCTSIYGSQWCSCQGSAFDRDSVSTLGSAASDSDTTDSRCKLANLAATLKRVGERNSLLTLDVGLPNGVLGGWPARKLQNEQIAGTCSSSSCQTSQHLQSNWWTAAKTARKNIVLLVERTTAITDSSKITLAVEAALSALSSADFINVVVISESITSPVAFPKRLVPATRSNLDIIRSHIQTSSFVGAANYENAFKEAYQILQNSIESGVGVQCSSTITTGIAAFIADFSSSRQRSSLASFIETQRQNIRSRVSFVTTSQELTSLPSLSCAGDGILISLSDIATENVTKQVMRFYDTMAVSGTTATVWSEHESNGLSPSTLAATASLPCRTETGTLVAVVTARISRSVLVNLTAAEIASRNQFVPCGTNSADLESLRDFKCDNSLILGLTIGVPIGTCVLIMFLILWAVASPYSFQAFSLFVLTPVLFIPMLAVPWRFVMACVALTRSRGPKSALKQIFIQFGLLLIDIFVLPLLPLLVVGVYRIRFVVRKLKPLGFEAWSSVELHNAVVLESFLVIRDYLCLVIGPLLTLIAPWRFVLLYGFLYRAENWNLRGEILGRHIVFAFLDLCILPFFIPVFVISPWRWGYLVKLLRTEPKSGSACFPLTGTKESHIRVHLLTGSIYQLVFEYIGLALLDLFVLPIVALALPVPHRLIFCLYAARKAGLGSKDLCRLVLHQIGLGIYDYLTLPAAALVFFTFYRVRSCFQEVSVAPFTNRSGIDLRDYFSRFSLAMLSTDLHSIVWSHLAGLLVDILMLPFLVVTMLAPWRIFFVIPNLKSSKTAAEARMAILRQFGLSLGDIFVFLTSVISLVLAPWRGVFVPFDLLFLGLKGSSTLHKRVAITTFQLLAGLIDWLSLPAIAFIISTFYCLPWTVRKIRKRVAKTPWNSLTVCNVHLPEIQNNCTQCDGHGLSVRYSLIVHRAFWSAVIVAAFELLHIPFLVTSLISPWRFVFIILDCIKREDAWSKLKVIRRQGILAVVDVFCLYIPGLLHLVTIYRIPSLIQTLRTLSESWDAPADISGQLKLSGFYGRAFTFARYEGAIYQVLFMSLLDIFVDFLALLLAPVTLIVPWRAFWLGSDLYNSASPLQRRTAGWINFLLLLADALTLPFSLVLFLTVYRLPSLRERLTRNVPKGQMSTWGRALRARKEDEVWFVIFHSEKLYIGIIIEFFCLLRDLIALVFLVSSIIAPWRFSFAIADIALREKSGPRRLYVAASQLVGAIMDLILLPIPIVVHIATLYRIPSTAHTLKRTLGRLTWPSSFPTPPDGSGTLVNGHNWLAVRYSAMLHKVAWIGLLNILIDFLFLPFAICTAAVPWRGLTLLVDLVILRRGATAAKRRELILEQFALAMMDIFTLPASLIVLATVYRLPQAVRRIKRCVNKEQWNQAAIFFHDAPQPSSVAGISSDACLISRHTVLPHKFIWAAFGSLCVDFFSILASLLTLALPWRFAFVLLDIHAAMKIRHRRFAPLIQAALLPFDILTLPFLFIVCVTVVRVPSLLHRIKITFDDGKSVRNFWGKAVRSPAEAERFFAVIHSLKLHAFILMELGMLIFHVLQFVALLLSLLSPWRLVFSVSLLVKALRSSHSHDMSAAIEAVWVNCVLAVSVDLVLVWPVAVLLLAVPWRLVIFFLLEPRENAKHIQFFSGLLFQLFAGLMDTLTAVPALIVLLTVYRFQEVRKPWMHLPKEKRLSSFAPHGYIWKTAVLVVADGLTAVGVVFCACWILPLALGLYLKTLDKYKPKTTRDLRLMVLGLCFAAPFLWIAAAFYIISAPWYPVVLLMSYIAKMWKLSMKSRSVFIFLLREISKATADNTKLLFPSFCIVGPLQVILFVSEIIVLVFSLFNFALFYTLSLGWFFVPRAEKFNSTRPKLFSNGTVLLWMFVVVLLSPIYFVMYQLPRVVDIWYPFWSTIFNLCPIDARSTDICFDFYNSPVVSAIPWPAIWFFWVFFFTYGLLNSTIIIHKLEWQKFKVGGGRHWKCCAN